jgi:energy coupling factor transporter S component ThiW
MMKTDLQHEKLFKLVLSAAFIALGTAGSFLPFLTFPVGPSRCAPLQHLINILSAIFLEIGRASCRERVLRLV